MRFVHFRLEVESVRNNPSLHPSGAYIDIEHHLLRLALVNTLILDVLTVNVTDM